MISKYREKKALKVIEDRMRGINTIDLFGLDDETRNDALDICEQALSTLEKALIMYESREHIQKGLMK